MYSIHKIKTILGFKPDIRDINLDISSLEIDSRKIVDGKHCLFFCLTGPKRDGHNYIKEAYEQGIRNFVVSSAIKKLPKISGTQYLKVENVLKALQKIASFKRNECNQTVVVGITGSNAKTIVKEWLFQLCHPHLKSIRSPKSYNSQIGVALSLWKMDISHEIGIIEAGISKAGEMQTIENMINPNIGIFTNIGDSHSSGFSDINQKIEEKLLLFKSCKKIIVHSGHEIIYHALIRKYGRSRVTSWGYETSDDYKILNNGDGSIKIEWENNSFSLNVKNQGSHYIENLLHSIVGALTLGIDPNIIIQKVPLLAELEMRLEHIPGRDNSLLINDAYIADIASLEVALKHVASLSHQGPVTVVLSDFFDQLNEEEVYENIEILLGKYSVNRLISVGEYSEIIRFKGLRHHYPDTLTLIQAADLLDWQDQLVLIKGSRSFQLDALVNKLERSSHSAYLEIDIPSLHYNLSQIRNHCPQSCRMIAVIKASAYGAGIEKIATAINSHDPAYFAVAYADEGIKLRHHGIQKPIIILNPDEDKTDILHQFNLEPVIHNMALLQCMAASSRKMLKPINIHLKLDTGMHRLGFSDYEIEPLCSFLKNEKWLIIKTIFSHLSSSENPLHDDYTQNQATLFEIMSEKIKYQLEYAPKLHLLNSEGIWRFPQYSYDYVRAGITMYGISSHQKSLKKVHHLNAKIVSLKTYEKGESIGYSRNQILSIRSKIAVINIGYADGFRRAGSNGAISVYINGSECPVVGNICMDVAMIDVTNCENVKVGDNAEIFGKNIPIEKMAMKLGTIPYEILCGISPRIVRKYIMD